MLIVLCGTACSNNAKCAHCSVGTGKFGRERIRGVACPTPEPSALEAVFGQWTEDLRICTKPTIAEMKTSRECSEVTSFPLRIDSFHIPPHHALSGELSLGLFEAQTLDAAVQPPVTQSTPSPQPYFLSNHPPTRHLTVQPSSRFANSHFNSNSDCVRTDCADYVTLKFAAEPDREPLSNHPNNQRPPIAEH
jgi:hypothetical protein